MAQVIENEIVVGKEKQIVKYEEKRWFLFKYLVKVKTETIGREVLIFSGDEPITQIYFNGKPLLN